jgi:tetratricopeptide (TPR) repeat protein
VALAPEYATTELELAQAYYEAYSGQQNMMAEREDAVELYSPFLDFLGFDGSFGSIMNLAANTLPVTVRWQAAITAREQELENSYLKPALHYFLNARDLCPLLGKPHARLAAHVDLLTSGDSGSQYMERVRYLRQYDPEVWYISGILALTAGKEKEAWESWKRSLEYSDVYLLDIGRRCLTILSPDELIDDVIPDNPRQLYRLAMGLFPKPTEHERRLPFLNEALELLEHPDQEMTWEDWRLKAQVFLALGRYREARTAFQTAIQHDPSQIELRLEYATFLHERGFEKEARAEVLAILAKDPNHTKSKALLAAFEKKANRR